MRTKQPMPCNPCANTVGRVGTGHAGALVGSSKDIFNASRSCLLPFWSGNCATLGNVELGMLLLPVSAMFLILRTRGLGCFANLNLSVCRFPSSLCVGLGQVSWNFD